LGYAGLPGRAGLAGAKPLRRVGASGNFILSMPVGVIHSLEPLKLIK